MLFTTTAQWVVLALALIGGWLLGLASHSGGRRWRERYAAEREAHAATRKEADARYAELKARQAELERDHARLRSAAPVTAATVAPATTSPAATTTVDSAGRPIATSAARPAYDPATGERRGWFDWRR